MLLHLYKWILALSEPLRGRLRQPATSHKCAFWAHSCLLFNRTFLRSFLSNKKSPSLIIKDESPRVTTLNSAMPHGHLPHRRFRHRLTRFPLSPAQLRDHLLPPLCSPFSPTGVSESFLSAYSSLPSFFHMMPLVYPVQINLSRHPVGFRGNFTSFS